MSPRNGLQIDLNGDGLWVGGHNVIKYCDGKFIVSLTPDFESEAKRLRKIASLLRDRKNAEAAFLLRYDRSPQVMLVQADTAKRLAQIILVDANDKASAVGPFNVRDRKENWLVIGPAIEGEAPDIIRRTFYIFFRKVGAEVTGIGYCFEFAAQEDVEALWRQHAAPSTIAAWKQRPEVQPYAATLDLFEALHGGILNKPEFAIAYALVLLDFIDTVQQDLTASEQLGVWNIFAANKKIIGFARKNGKIVFPL